MCSVVGYIGKNHSRAFVIEGLSRLEYRGYDSAGFACLTPEENRIVYAKSSGKISSLVQKLRNHTQVDGFVGIGHTRWSTHGISTEVNAHPHFDCNKSIAVVHNGIIENHHSLKIELERSGHVFFSNTDTEIIAHLFEVLLPLHTTLQDAIMDLVSRLKGAYAFILISDLYPDQMIIVRKRSPICIGVGEREMFVASDLLAFAGKTSEVLFLPDESFAVIKQDAIQLCSFSGKELSCTMQKVDFDWSEQEKNGHDHYMLKEIYDQKNAIHATVDFLQSISSRIWDYIGITDVYAKNLSSICLIGSGTSWHATRIAQFFFESVCLLPTRVYLASEFRHMSFFTESNCLYVFVSQSGETADTLEALRLVNDKGLPTVALTNIPSSTMVREAGGFLLTQAGPEIAVASTKAFSTQLTALYWLAHRLAQQKNILDSADVNSAEDDLLITAEVLENSIETYKRDITKKHAKMYARYKKAIFLGRHISYPFALESALKLKEIAYVFSQCYPAGELKHGPLALIDDETPVFVFSHQNPVIYSKIVSNVQEVKARGGHIVVFGFEGQDELNQLADLCFMVPCTKELLGPLATTGLMQFFMYAIAKESALPIDKPRNLAKSVTVE